MLCCLLAWGAAPASGGYSVGTGAQPGRAAAPPATAPTRAGERGTTIRALVVEDHAPLRDAIAYLLAGRGYEVTACRSGAAAWEACQRDGYPLILVDLGLPDMDGLEVCRRVRSLPNGDDSFILVVTTRDRPEDLAAVIEAGANDYLAKPFDVRGLEVRLAIAERQIAEFARRKRAEDALRRSEQRFRALIEHSSEGIVLLAPDATILYSGPSSARVMGYASDALVGRCGLELIHPDDRAAAASRVAYLLEEPGRVVTAEFRVRHGDGSWRWIEGIGTNLLHEPSVEAIAANFSDVTERRRTEERLRFLAEASAVLAASLEYEETLRSVAHLAVATLADYCLVDVVEADGRLRRVEGAFRSPVHAAVGLDLLHRTAPDPNRPNSPTAQVFRSGKSEIVPEITDEWLVRVAAGPEHLQVMRQIAPRSLMAVPVIGGRQPLGVLSFGSTQVDRQYGPADLALAENLATRAALAIENARLYRQAQQQTEALRYRAEIERLVTTISTRFISLQRGAIDPAIAGALAAVGEFAGVDRSYVFRFSNDATTMDNTHEWCAEGIEPQIHLLKGLPVDLFPWWMERLNRLETVHIPRVADLPAEAGAERAILQIQGIHSLVVVPLVYQGALLGFLGFDSVRAEKAWMEEDIILLKMVADSFAHAFVREHAERERTRLMEEVARLEAQAAIDRAKSEFVSVVSHEFRAPLSALIGFTELLLTRDASEPDRREWIRTMHEQAQRLANLVDDMLDASQIDEGHVALMVQPVDLRNAAGRILASLQTHMSAHRLELRFADHVPPALADPDKLAQILMNLLSNAIKYSPEGGGVIVSAAATETTVRLSVADEGLGLPPGEIPNLFKRFHRIDDWRRREIRGTGLGLYITRHLVELHGGRIWAESPGPGLGSTFHVELPAAPVEVRHA